MINFLEMHKIKIKLLIFIAIITKRVYPKHTRLTELTTLLNFILEVAYEVRTCV